MNNKITTIELFAGIGGFRLASDHLGLKTIWANDINEDAVKVYKDNYGEDSIIQGDINDLIDSIPKHDILTGGFPCQPFSKAGKKQGVQDYRGTLFEAIVKILYKNRPSFFVLENVNSLLYLDGGKNYQTILSALSSIDYKIEWRVFNAMEFGIPQHRERIIIVGSRNRSTSESYLLYPDEVERMDDELKNRIAHWDIWETIEETKKIKPFNEWGMAFNGKFTTMPIRQHNKEGLSIKSILQEDVGDEFDYTEETIKRIENSIKVDRFYNGVQIKYNQKGGARMGYTIFGTDGVAPTLTASTSRHYERYQIGDRFRRLTNVEYARLQGFPDDHCKAVKPYIQYKLFGNAVPHQIVQYALTRLTQNQFTSIKSNQLTIFD